MIRHLLLAFWSTVKRMVCYIEAHLSPLTKIVIFSVCVEALLIDTASWIPWWANICQRVISATAMTFLALRHMKRNLAKIDVDNTKKLPDPEPVKIERAISLLRSATMNRKVTDQQAEVFMSAIIAPNRVRQRVVERYEPSQRTLEQLVTIDVQIPRKMLSSAGGLDNSVESGKEADRSKKGDEDSSTADSVAFFPVVLPPKGELYDNFNVYSADDTQLPTLSYRESLRVAADVLHVLFEQAYVSKDLPKDLPTNLSAEIMALEIIAIWAIIQRRYGFRSAPLYKPQEHNKKDEQKDESSGKEPNTLEAYIEKYQKIRDDPEALAQAILNLRNPKRMSALGTAARLVKLLATNYAMVVLTPVGSSGKLVVKYARTLIPEIDPSQDRQPSEPKSYLRIIRAKLNIFLGTRPVDVKISLDNAWTCQSYHALVHCPDGLYLIDQKIDLPDGYMKTRAIGSPTPPYLRFRRRLGQEYSHLYGRYLPAPPKEVRPEDDDERPKPPQSSGEAKSHLKLFLVFQEVPPGTLCRAAVTAIASAVVVWIIGFGLSLPDRDLFGDATDAPALLLAFPGVAASWISIDTAARRLFEGPLTARLSLACTTLISMVGIAFYLLGGHTPKVDDLHGGPYLAVFGIAGVPWCALFTIALANAVYVTYKWLMNTARYRRLAERPEYGRLGVKPGRRSTAGTD